jgi:carbon-monoxide dehydrogenase medium subunit
VKPPPFAYCAPDTLDEAVALKAEHGDDAAILAGGQSLIPLLALRVAAPPVVIDLGRVPQLEFVRNEGDMLVVGAMARHRAVERLRGLAGCPVLADAVPLIGHVAIRNQGTVGGSLAHADPAAEWPALALALDAVVEATGPGGTRTIDAADLFVTHFTTAVAADEVLTRVTLPLPRGRMGSAFVELARRHGDFALAGVAAVLGGGDDGTITSARVVLMGVAETPVRVVEAEAALAGAAPARDRLADAAELCAKAVTHPGDLHGSAAYRAEITRVLARRALAVAASRMAAP